MGCTVRDKHRSTRRNRSVKPDIDPCCLIDKDSISKSMLESGFKSSSYHLCLNDSTQSPNPTPNHNTNTNFNDHGLGYCTEEQLEEFLLKNLEFLYNEAISKLVALGYDEDVALKAILRNGHCYGGMDVLTNILHNSLAYLNSSCGSSNGSNSEETDTGFPDLRQLQEYSLAGMVCLLQQVRPHLSKGDVMWCLLMSDLHVGKASTMEIPLLPSPSNGCTPVLNNLDNIGNNGVGVVSPALCRFHGGWGFGNGAAVNGFFSNGSEMTLQRDIECPERFNLSPSMKSLLKRNVAMFAASFRANSKQTQTQNQTCVAMMPSGDAPLAAPGSDVPAEKADDSRNLKSQDGVTSVLSKFRDLNIDENLEHVGEVQRGEMIISLLHQIKDLEKQVKERKEWAHQKAIQAARKLSNDLTELKMLRMEREEMQQMKKGKHKIEDSTMKRLSEMENALKKASGQVDRANAAVRRLETENAEIRAEMEASKLSASESVTTCLEVAKREKKCLKKLLAWEKQKTKLMEEIADEKEKIIELQRCLARVEQDQKETESNWKEELKAKEVALAQLEQERHSKEVAEASNKRKLEALRLKIEIDFQRLRDDHQRLEQELSRLKLSAQSTELNHQTDNLLTGKSEGAKPQGETIAKLLHELDKHQDSSENEVISDRECIICSKDEVSVVFLPCAHQVLCANCNESYGKKGKATCPCCWVPIEQRIRVYGATS
ncbi:MND1-interacting protein 1 [Hibiscus syriacus]|uniref:MND1-interacting protein 1 n=1 Tax=Hibiscus syriacus TaxID=106335 RepID=A0A6A3BCJ2_HIBSY|nr:MND1-interacting protein 1-like [Hibiscus syriacus]KAE8713777.1 MND1-interacting protein 1 [Hibiscus syriacus]